ncbi:hypothetical protein SAMN05444412_12040 [Rhodonellum ikkaensis]|uniref:Uncharacterized protein n=1 Tax=Rhodonellum ikkaensis TaxID=336829 RepID=A0A1H3TTF3_9BACT|nr:hypothetical protein SAMN05444412_12040 [Rhodonellum ikkaensis]
MRIGKVGIPGRSGIVSFACLDLEGVHPITGFGWIQDRYWERGFACAVQATGKLDDKIGIHGGNEFNLIKR